MALFCTECTYQFFYDPVKVGVASVSLLLAVAVIVFLRYRRQMNVKWKMTLMYAHIFFLVFPFVFFFMFKGCESLFATCNSTTQLIVVVGLALAISIGVGLIVGPILFVISARTRSIKATEDDEWYLFTQKYAGIQGVHGDVELRYVQEIEPKAFSISWPRRIIFISIGLLDVLGDKEVEAVLLHELYHISSRSSVFKSVQWYFRVTSPLALFVTFEDDLNCEEKEADAFAATMQGTMGYIISSKEKINAFLAENNS